MRSMMRLAGIGLLVMAVLAAWANFGVLDGVRNSDDMAASLTDRETSVRFAAVAFLSIAVLDVVVAWALRQLSEQDAPVADLAAMFRYLYAGVLIVAAAGLSLAAGESREAEHSNASGIAGMELFDQIWSAGLLLFGIHLTVLGLVFVANERLPSIIGWLLIVAGATYAADSVIAVISPSFGFEFASVGFVGEVALMGWLLWKGFGRQGSTPSPDRPA